MDGDRAEEKTKNERERGGGFLQGVKESAHRGSPRLVTVYSTGMEEVQDYGIRTTTYITLDYTLENISLEPCEK